MVRLTARQSEILGFISENIVHKGRPPTLREIGSHFGIASPNGVNCHLKALKKKGAIEIDPEVCRGIRIPGVKPIRRPQKDRFVLPFYGIVR